MARTQGKQHKYDKRSREKVKKVFNNGKNNHTKSHQPQKTKQSEILERRKKEQLEKERRILESKKKRLQKTKAMSKRTPRGQPIMKNRIELLLQQIQEMKRS